MPTHNVSEKSLANLKPAWGTPGNPPPKSPGRPPRRIVSEAYEKLLLRAAPPEICAAMKRFGCPEHGARWVDVLGAAMIREGLKGSAFAAKELRETVQGKAPIAIELFEDREVSISVSFENVLATRMPAIDVEPGSTEELPGSSSGSSSDGESSDE